VLETCILLIVLAGERDGAECIVVGKEERFRKADKMDILVHLVVLTISKLC
jgi:hypothetical protein